MKRKIYTDNPCVVIDDYNNPHLNVFLNFFYEESLPKWKDSQDKNELAKMSTAVFEQSLPSMRSHTSSDVRYKNQMSQSLKNIKTNGKSIWATILSIFKKKKTSAEVVFEDAKKEMRVANTTKELEDAKTASEKLLFILEKSGQISQAEKVRDYINILSGEIVLMNHGFGKYLLEEDVIDFMLKAERGVMIDFLRSYSQILPLDVAEKKIACDNLKVFDNYCVMFYDDSIAAFRLIKDESIERKARDPILFGMIEGSNKLYYITDWVFKDDDLTMEKVETTIGRKARTIETAEIIDTNITINNFLENVDDWIQRINSVSGQTN